MDTNIQPFGETKIIAYTNWLIRWRWAVIALTIIATFAVTSGGRFLTLSTDYRDFFGEENPQLQAYDKLQRVYTKDDNYLIALKPDNGKVFEPNFLRAVRELTDAAWRIPYATRVTDVGLQCGTKSNFAVPSGSKFS